MNIKDRILAASEKGYSVDKQGNVWYNDNLRVLRSNRGYMEFAIRCDGEKRPQNVPVHGLQAYQKFGNKIFEPGIVVRHLDGNSLNNNFDNIEIGTQQENMMDIPAEQRIAHAKHAASAQIKYNADEIKLFHAKSCSYAKTMEHFDIKSKGTLFHILNKR